MMRETGGTPRGGGHFFRAVVPIYIIAYEKINGIVDYA